MMRWLPRIDHDSWGGAGIDGKSDCRGHSFAVQWLGLLLEFNVARVTKRKGKL